MKSGLKQASGAGLHDRHEVKGRKVLVVLGSLLGRQRPKIRLVRKFIEARLHDRVGSQSDNLFGRIARQTFCKRFNDRIEKGVAHGRSISRRGRRCEVKLLALVKEQTLASRRASSTNARGREWGR